jgi:hypothetical protein
MVISWTSYLTVSFLLLLFYYSAVVLLYFRKDIALRLKKDRASVPQPSPDSVLFAEPTQQQGNKLDAASAAPMHSLVDEIQAYINQAGQQGVDKGEVTISIKKLLKKYPAIKGSIFQAGITNLIAVIAEDKCAIHFNADELRELWDE